MNEKQEFISLMLSHPDLRDTALHENDNPGIRLFLRFVIFPPLFYKILCYHLLQSVIIRQKTEMQKGGTY